MEIEITKSTTTYEEMRSFDDEFNNLISNDMLVKEKKVDILIEKVQLLHTCIDSLKNEINTHITTTSNQYAIINDQLQSIRSQNKLNAKSTQDQIESMENTALEINSKLQHQQESLFRKLQAIQEIVKMLNEKKPTITEKQNHQTERPTNQPLSIASIDTNETY